MTTGSILGTWLLCCTASKSIKVCSNGKTSTAQAKPDSLQELLGKCHPLGMFDSISTLAVASNMRELYRLVLVDTPLAPYFAESLTSGVQTFVLPDRIMPAIPMVLFVALAICEPAVAHQGQLSNVRKSNGAHAERK